MTKTNPLRSLAARDDLIREYSNEIKTDELNDGSRHKSTVTGEIHYSQSVFCGQDAIMIVNFLNFRWEEQPIYRGGSGRTSCQGGLQDGEPEVGLYSDQPAVVAILATYVDSN